MNYIFFSHHQIMSPSYVCRPKNDDCDLQEYCTGKSAECPEDVFTVNGLPCKNGNGFCYNGQCPLREDQCIKMWGPSEYARTSVLHWFFFFLVKILCLFSTIKLPIWLNNSALIKTQEDFTTPSASVSPAINILHARNSKTSCPSSHLLIYILVMFKY